MSITSEDSHFTSASHMSTGSGSSRSSVSKNSPHWMTFRKDVLALHHIRIVDNVSVDTIPQTILDWIDDNRSHGRRFTKQRLEFRRQVSRGRAFGTSALFPSEVLPPVENQPFLTRCMVPTFSIEALPEKVLAHASSSKNLSAPKPGLGCGFSALAFGGQEAETLPAYMIPSGTNFDMKTGAISNTSALHCPFLTFERVFKKYENSLEVANNQCAVNGAWCVRAYQMLHARAGNRNMTAAPLSPLDRPISFTCCIDNELSQINISWVDHAQVYCTAPVVKFDLRKDAHFDQFLLWIEAIEQWAITDVLPEIKRSIDLIQGNDSMTSALELAAPTPLIEKNIRQQQLMLSSLRTDQLEVPRNHVSGPISISPIDSGDADSCSSPVIDERSLKKLNIPFHYPIVPQARSLRTGTGSVCSEKSDGSSRSQVRFANPLLNGGILGNTRLPRSAVSNRSNVKTPLTAVKVTTITPAAPLSSAPQPAYAMSSDLVLRKRLNHAMNEIADLQNQLLIIKNELSGSTSSITSEISGLRKDVTCVIRKEAFMSQRKTPTSPFGGSFDNFGQIEGRLTVMQSQSSIITTPTDPKAMVWPRTNPTAPTRPSSLKNVLLLDTSVEAAFTFKTPMSASGQESPTIFFSPIVVIPSQPVFETGVQHLAAEESETKLLTIPTRARSDNWSATLVQNLLSIMLPSTMLRIIILGFMLDYCMNAMGQNGNHSVSRYVSTMLERPA